MIAVNKTNMAKVNDEEISIDKVNSLVGHYRCQPVTD